MLDVNRLNKASVVRVRRNGEVIQHVWHARSHGVEVIYKTADIEARYWVSPIWNMREKGVALIDSSGQMVKCERRDR